MVFTYESIMTKDKFRKTVLTPYLKSINFHPLKERLIIDLKNYYKKDYVVVAYSIGGAPRARVHVECIESSKIGELASSLYTPFTVLNREEVKGGTNTRVTTQRA